MRLALWYFIIILTFVTCQLLSQERDHAFSQHRDHSAADSVTAGWVTAYYPIHALCDLPPQKLVYKGYTHIVYFTAEPIEHYPFFNLFAGSKDSLTMETGLPGWCKNPLDAGPAPKTHLQILKDSCRANNIKLLLCIGGDWGQLAVRFQKMVLDTTKQNVFIDAALGFARRNGYDGIDIDWEYPGPDTRDLYSRFLRKVRAVLDEWTPRGILAMAVGPEARPDLIDPAVANEVADQINIMNYGMGEGMYSGYNSPLRRPNLANYDSWTITDHGALQYIQKGFAREKLGMLLPYEAKRWVGVDGPGQQRKSNPDVVSNDEVFGKLAQYPGGYHWDSVSQVPWLGFVEHGTKYFYSYDDSLSLLAKIQWAESLQLGGIGYWELWRKAHQNEPRITSTNLPPNSLPHLVRLNQNYPNPFNSSTTISYQIPDEGQVDISVFDLLGRRVTTLVAETLLPGEYQTIWNPTNAATGMYLLRFEYQSTSIPFLIVRKTVRMFLIR